MGFTNSPNIFGGRLILFIIIILLRIDFLFTMLTYLFLKSDDWKYFPFIFIINCINLIVTTYSLVYYIYNLKSTQHIHQLSFFLNTMITVLGKTFKYYD
jgi:hypothetical protein